MQAVMTAQVEDVEREFHAQLRRAREAGIRISHLSSCYGAVFARTDLAERFLRLSIKYWIPADVVELTPEHIERFRQEGFELSDQLIQLVQDYPLPKLDDIQFAPLTDTYEQKRDQFCQMIRDMPPGLTQVVLTPAAESPGLAGISTLWEQAVWESRLLDDQQVQCVFREEAVIFTNWREIMRRYQGQRPAVEEAEDEDGGE
jgi:hypothetical protein